MYREEPEVKNLLDYIYGERRGKRAHDLEREAMQDPFLQDALDGYDSVKGKHGENISRMQQEILSKTKKKKSGTFYWYAAASVLLLISVGIYILFQNQEKNSSQEIAYQAEVKLEDTNTDTISSFSQKDEKSAPLENTKPSQPFRQEAKENAPLAQLSPPVSKTETPSEDYWVYEDHSDKRMKEAVSPPAPAPSIAMDKTYDEKSISGISQNDKDIVLDGATTQSKQYEVDTLKEEDPLAEVIIGYKSKKKRKAADIAVARGEVKAIPVIGTDAYNKYLKNTIFLSKNTECEQAQGTAILEFTVDSSGRPQNIKVIQSLCKALDNQLIDLIKKGSDWTEGQGRVEFIQ